MVAQQRGLGLGRMVLPARQSAIAAVECQDPHHPLPERQSATPSAAIAVNGTSGTSHAQLTKATPTRPGSAARAVQRQPTLDHSSCPMTSRSSPRTNFSLCRFCASQPPQRRDRRERHQRHQPRPSSRRRPRPAPGSAVRARSAGVATPITQLPDTIASTPAYRISRRNHFVLRANAASSATGLMRAVRTPTPPDPQPSATDRPRSQIATSVRRL